MHAVNGWSTEADVNMALVEALVVEMFASVASSVATASEAFLCSDRDAARQIVADDRHIDDLLATVESMAESGLVDADDLDRWQRRLLVYVLRTAPELERSADLIEHIALRTPQGLAALIPLPARAALIEMATIASDMWRDAFDGFTRRDATVASMLRLHDEALDDLHVELTAELAGSECSPAVVIEMGLIARFYERLGDHAVNVARRTIDLTAG